MLISLLKRALTHTTNLKAMAGETTASNLLASSASAAMSRVAQAASAFTGGGHQRTQYSREAPVDTSNRLSLFASAFSFCCAAVLLRDLETAKLGIGQKQASWQLLEELADCMLFPVSSCFCRAACESPGDLAPGGTVENWPRQRAVLIDAQFTGSQQPASSDELCNPHTLQSACVCQACIAAVFALSVAPLAAFLRLVRSPPDTSTSSPPPSTNNTPPQPKDG